MNKEFNGFDEMVEALEENEDMVECKECFDLVPKVDCERAEVGYICPTCKGLRTAPAQARFVDPYDSYTQDFPEVTEYDPGSMVEYEKEPGLGDALSDLIKDEYEAIDGYEAADETVQHADIDEDEKDEILDTLDHIKEEEEEHIDELKELCPDCDPVAEPKAESEKLEEAADDEVADEEAEVEEIPEEDIPEEEAEDSEENENEEVSDLDSAYEAALEIANESGVGQVFGYARKETEEFVAIEPFEVDDPEAVEDDLMAVYDDVAYAYVAYPEKELEESLFESVQLNEGPGRFLKGLGQKIGNAAKHAANKDSGKLIDKFFNEGYTLIFEGPKEGMPAEHKSEYDTADQALTAALHLSKEYPKYKIWVFAKPIDESDLTPREKTLAKAKNGLGAVIGCFRNGTALQKKDKEIADTLKKIEIDKQDLMKTTGRTTGESNGDPRDSVGDDETEDNSEAEEDEDPNLDDEEESEKEPEEEPKEEPAADNKLVIDDISDEALIKFYSRVTGNMVSGEPGKRAAVLKRIRNALRSSNLGEGFDPDLGEDELIEALQSEADAVKSLKATANSLKSTAASMQNMTSAMREEYHKYANPAELKVMEDLEAIVDAAKNDALSSMRDWGIDIRESDSQGWMSGNNEYSYQFMIDYEGIDEDEEEDVQDQLGSMVENAVLSQYTLPPELSKISVSVALPDRDIAYEDEDGEELQDVKRASLFVDVTFARNLF